MATLATLMAVVRGVKFYDMRNARVHRGERVVLRRAPNNPFDRNCVDVLLRGGLLLGHLEAPVAARLSLLMRAVPVEVVGYVLAHEATCMPFYIFIVYSFTVRCSLTSTHAHLP